MQSSFKKHFQLIVFRKLLGWKLEKSYTKKSIFVTSAFTKDLFETRMEKRIGFRTCSTIRSRATIYRSFQSNQPIPNPIRERSGRLASTQDARKTSRSQEIDVNSSCEEPSSSERTGRPVETNVNPTRSSEDRKDFNVEQTRERTERPV